MSLFQALRSLPISSQSAAWLGKMDSSLDFSSIAATGDGAMVGDYMTLSYAGGRAVPIFSLASERAPDGTFRQSIFAQVR